MPIFVQLVTFESSSGMFDEKKDTRRVNEVLTQLQNKGAKIINIGSSVGGKGDAMTSSLAAVYLITYEATGVINI